MFFEIITDISKRHNGREEKKMVVGEKNGVIVIDNYLLYVSVIIYQVIQL